MSNNRLLRSIQVSTPGKVILFGEHAVVYGKTAIAASLDLRTISKIYEVAEQIFKIDCRAVDVQFEFKEGPVQDLLHTTFLKDFDPVERLSDHEELLNIIDHFLKRNIPSTTDTQYRSLSVFFYLFVGILRETTVHPFTICIDTRLTIGSGMGSSGSFAVAVAASLFLFRDGLFDKTRQPDSHELNAIANWAHAAERIIHGTPSGIDTTVCTFGGIVEFKKGEKPKSVLVPHKLDLLLIDTKLPRDTRALVNKVAELRSRFNHVVDNIMDAIDNISHAALHIISNLEEDSHNKLNELMYLNHSLLVALGVSHPELERACDMARSHGAAAKLTGAGGGGFAVALPPPGTDITVFAQCFTNAGFSVFTTMLGGSGVVIEDCC